MEQKAVSVFHIGTGYIGSADLETSEAGKEIVPSGYVLYSFWLKCLNANANGGIKISVNGSNPIYLQVGQEFRTTGQDAPIKSFKILEDGISYSWLGAY